jgi:hypothetical protein
MRLSFNLAAKIAVGVLASGVSFFASAEITAALPSDTPSPILKFNIVGTESGINWTSADIGFTLDRNSGDFSLASPFSYSANRRVTVDGVELPAFVVKVDPTDSQGNRVFERATGGNVDPFMSYAYSIANNTSGALAVSAYFTSPIIPGINGQANTVSARASGILVDATGNGASLTYSPGTTSFQSFALSSLVNAPQGDASFVNAGVNVGAVQSIATGAPGSVAFINTVESGVTAGPLGVWNTMQMYAHFTLSGSGDIALVTGYGEIIPVPEPSDLAFMLSGLVVTASMMARRRKASTDRG